MDKNSFFGLLLIGGILIGWMYWSAPSKEEMLKQRRIKDSALTIQRENEIKQQISTKLKDTGNALIKTDSSTTFSDSVKTSEIKNKYGVFAGAAQGKNEVITLENELIKISLNTLGGRVASVELKNYKTNKGLPLILFDADSSYQSVQFIAQSRGLSTDSLYFIPEGKSFYVKGNDSAHISLRLYAGDKSRYIEYVYSLSGNGYLLKYKINTAGLQDIIASNTSDITLRWGMKTPTQEKNMKNEKASSTIYYKYAEDEVDNVSENKDEKKSLDAKLKWISFKQQFFTSVLIAETAFEKPTDIESIKETGSEKYVKSFSAQLSIPYNHLPFESFGMSFYFGPNHYKTLKKYNLEFEKQVPLGWGIFGWVNRLLVIPIFDFLSGFNLNYGIVILILTLVIKALLFFIAYKTYLASAKMRVLKPELEELNKKFGTSDPLKKQQAQMELYRKSGVNPLAGCIPVLLQMPILLALFRFFPASIELRQQSFLWAKDLSTYDSIWDFGYVPFINTIYGDHVSLFTLLMTASTILYTYNNSQLMGGDGMMGGGNSQMPNMKWMMYVFPIILIPVLNNYSAGLSYYYLLANLITFGQTFIMRAFVDEDALRKKIEENKRKPVKVSGFQKRLQQMAKERQDLSQRKR